MFSLHDRSEEKKKIFVVDLKDASLTIITFTEKSSEHAKQMTDLTPLWKVSSTVA